jgi:uncharacterized protein YqgV (UPF0045/DUF77 family)
MNELKIDTEQLRDAGEKIGRIAYTYYLLKTSLWRIRSLPELERTLTYSYDTGIMILDTASDLSRQVEPLHNGIEGLKYHAENIAARISEANEQLGHFGENIVKSVGAFLRNPIKYLSYKLKPMETLIKQAEDKLFEAFTEMKNVLNQVVATGMTVRIATRQMDDKLTPGLNQDMADLLYRLKMPRSFAEMDMQRLFGENSDIKRKGVMMGFNGEYWDPEQQQQCTFYAAARRTQLGRPLAPDAWGNAFNWGNSARARGHHVDNVPNFGDVFCSAGSYGHVGVVEHVYENGDILISEANYDLKGGHNVRRITPREYAFWQFIE